MVRESFQILKLVSEGLLLLNSVKYHISQENLALR
jgi:hypothetical protein